MTCIDANKGYQYIQLFWGTMYNWYQHLFYDVVYVLINIMRETNLMLFVCQERFDIFHGFFSKMTSRWYDDLIYKSLKLIYILLLTRTVNYKIRWKIEVVYFTWGSNMVPFHEEQEKSRFAHDCAIHWLHFQGNNFILNDYLRVYQVLVLKNLAIHIIHKIFSFDWVGLSIFNIHAVGVS